MTEIIKISLMIFVLGMLFVLAVSLISDYFDKKKQERKVRLQQERSRSRQKLNCKNCEMLLHCHNSLAECNQEKLHLENTVDSLYEQINILQSSLAKARMHRQSEAEDKTIYESE